MNWSNLIFKLGIVFCDPENLRKDILHAFVGAIFTKKDNKNEFWKPFFSKWRPNHNFGRKILKLSEVYFGP